MTATLHDRARLYLRKCPPAISGQGGHKAAFRAACAVVRGFELGEAEALAVLQEWNSGCQPPWSEAELRHKIKSAKTAQATYMAGSPKLSPRKNMRKSETKPSRIPTSQRRKMGRRGNFAVGREALLVFIKNLVVDGSLALTP